MADQTLAISSEVLRKLADAKSRLTFGPDDNDFYTGVHDPAARAQADAAFARLTDTLIERLAARPSKAFVLEQFQLALESLCLTDTEDRERAAGHCVVIMDILEIESSDGVLNRWLYGESLGSSISAKQQ